MLPRLDNKELYWSGEYGPGLWGLKCNCGQTCIIERSKFAGKRRTRSCRDIEGQGNPDCTNLEGPRPDHPKVRQYKQAMASILVQLPLGLIEELQEVATNNKLSRASVIRMCLRFGLDNFRVDK